MVLGAIPPLAIRLHKVLLIGNFATFCSIQEIQETKRGFSSVMWEERRGAALWVTNELIHLFGLQVINLLVAFHLLNAVRIFY